MYSGAVRAYIRILQSYLMSCDLHTSGIPEVEPNNTTSYLLLCPFNLDLLPLLFPIET